MSDKVPQSLGKLVARFDPGAFDRPPDERTVIELAVTELGSWLVGLENDRATLLDTGEAPVPQATLAADEQTWEQVVEQYQQGMEAFRSGRLQIRRNLHVGIGFLAATSGAVDPGRLRVRSLQTPVGAISALEAGTGPTVIMLHGLGATKASMLPLIAALADSHQAIAIDLPGFGDSVKPLAAPYNAQFFARATLAVLDSLGVERADVIGHSLGGRVALEAGLSSPDRTNRLVLIAPSLAWRRGRRWAPYLRLLRPELGLIQITPRRAVEVFARRAIAGATNGNGWAEAGVEEFLRLYLSPRGRAAFYAAARQIYLEEPDGDNGFWPRLGTLAAPALFLWGRQDRLVPAAFARHVREVLPRAKHVELDCGHVPQFERSRQTQTAIERFLRPS